MTLEEVRVKLLDALTNGRLTLDLKGFVLGFASAMKGKKGPSARQVEIARRLVREIRHHDGTEPVELIDQDDSEAAHEQASDYEEF